MMRAAEPVAGQDLIGIGGKVPIGEEQEFYEAKINAVGFGDRRLDRTCLNVTAVCHAYQNMSAILTYSARIASRDDTFRPFELERQGNTSNCGPARQRCLSGPVAFTTTRETRRGGW